MVKKKRSGPKGPRPGSAATYIRGLIKEGWDDAIISRKVKRKFPAVKLVTKAGKHTITWYRWQLRTKKGV